MSQAIDDIHAAMAEYEGTPDARALELKLIAGRHRNQGHEGAWVDVR